jgi:transposase
MLGPPKSRRLDQPIAASLEDLVPGDHFYRHLEAKLDLGFVRDWVAELYAERGRPSIDPVIFFKLQLVMFFEDIRSAQLINRQSQPSTAGTSATPSTRNYRTIRA